MSTKQLMLIETDPSSCRSAPEKPFIISASRRTDLPGFYPSQCAELIAARIRRLRTRFLYGVMFWTKQPLPFLTNPNLFNMVTELANPMVQLTVTGLGSTALEPGIPSPETVIAALPRLVTLFKNDPRRIRWRFDPILKNWNGLDQFNRLAAPMSQLGVRECTISFPTYFSLKGNLKSQFTQAGIPSWHPEEQQQFLMELVRAAENFGITLRSCAQPLISRLNPRILPAACVDAALFESLHPQKLPLELPPDPSQRKHCHCAKSEDIGNYTEHRCGGGCAYCYSRAGGRASFNKL